MELLINEGSDIMAEFYRFFDSTLEDPRKYDADEFAEYFRQILTDGVFNGGTNLQVTCDGTNMKVQITEGYGWIKGYLYKVDNLGLELQHDTADVTFDRIDRVVLRWDKDNRYIKAFVLKGVPSASPVAPSLTRDDNIHEISLAQVKVLAGKSFIAYTEITDERLDANVCGLVNSLVQVDTTAMQQKFDDFMSTLMSETYVTQNDFNTETSNLKNQLTDVSTYPTATGNETEIVVSTGVFNLVDGQSFTFVASANNNGLATTINADNKGAKLVFKPNTTDAPNIISGKAYTVWFNEIGDNFFTKASAEGNAVAGDVLAGKKFSNDDDTGLIGTLDLTQLTPDNIRKDVTINSVTGDKLKYGVGDYVDASYLEQMTLEIGGHYHSWNDAITYLYTSTGGSSNDVYRRNPITGDQIWLASLKASDGYGASGFNILCVTNGGLALGTGGERSTMSENFTFLSTSGSFVKGPSFSGDSNKPYVYKIGRQMNSGLYSGSSYLCYVTNSGSHDGIRMVNTNSLGYRIASNYGQYNYNSIDRVRGHLLAFVNLNSKWQIYRYNASDGTLVDNWDTGISSSLYIYYDDGDSDHVYFTPYSGGTVYKHSLVSKSNLLALTTEFYYFAVIGTYDEDHLLVQEQYTSAVDKYKVYKVPKSTLLNRIELPVISAKLVNEGISLTSKPLFASSKEAVYVQDKGKFGLNSLGVRITG